MKPLKYFLPVWNIFNGFFEASMIHRKVNKYIWGIWEHIDNWKHGPLWIEVEPNDSRNYDKIKMQSNYTLHLLLCKLLKQNIIDLTVNSLW